MGLLGPRVDASLAVQFGELTGALTTAQEQGWVSGDEASGMCPGPGPLPFIPSGGHSPGYAGQVDESAEQEGVGV